MASVKIKNINGAKRSINDLLNRVVTNPVLLKEIATELHSHVISSARAGRDPNKKVFPSLSDSWIKKRDYLKKQNSPDEYFLDSKKGNVTFTGKFLDSAVTNIVANQGLVELKFEGNHPGYKVGNTTTKPVSNSKLRKYLEELGFRFFFVGDQFQKVISVKVKRFLRRGFLKK